MTHRLVEKGMEIFEVSPKTRRTSASSFGDAAMAQKTAAFGTHLPSTALTISDRSC
jgi:hypothetical protein